MPTAPTLDTPRLRLRPVTLDDADAYYTAIMRDPEVRRYLPGGQSRPRYEAESILTYFIDHWRTHGFGGWAVMRRGEERLIGQCGLAYIPHSRNVELYYALAKDAWGHGYATEAAHAALRYGFESAGLERIYALFVPGNVASERVMIKLGMRYDGLRDAYNTQLPSYVMTAAEFRARDALQRERQTPEDSASP